ncbi:MAG: TolC family protein [Acidobacteriaceae bacterium]
MAVTTPLAALLAEARANNPQIRAAEHGARAAQQVVSQKTALPDAKLTLQEFSVGSPRPFAGYSNSDFAYVGIGGSQELPYPGKLRLRGEVAEREAGTQQTRVEVAKAGVEDAVKTDYLELASLQETLGILQQDEALLDQLIEDATIHYKVGQGMQQDVLQAQVQRTRLLREVMMHHKEVDRLEAELKGLLHREQESPDISAEPLHESAADLTSMELLEMVRQHDPRVQVDVSSVAKQQAQLAAAKHEGKPDFGLSYLYENTDRKYRDYYMVTLDVRFARRKRVHAEIEEAAEMLAQAKETLDAGLQSRLAEAQQQYLQVSRDAELLKIYREGLLPQTEAVYRAMLSAYGANREPLSRVLGSLLDLLNLRLEAAKTLAEHETALAHLESMTGARLR